MTAHAVAVAVATNLRALSKRLLAWLRGEPLVDLRLLPRDLRAAMTPLVRPTVRYLTMPQAQRLIEAACALMASHEHVSSRHIAMAKTEAALGVAHAMAALAYEGTGHLPPSLQRQLADLRASLGVEEDG